ncbi:hypothetical protein GQ53DRAFT_838575 [Thozetella sp. PMI_491]|nr:hypothetical protein GQ53DRAFT_838575 [Thozetella sp. PMI_491]
MAGEPTLGDILGTPTNYTDTPPPINNPSTVLILTLCFLFLSWSCVLLRLYTRFFVIRCPGWDDFFVGIYLLTTTSGSVALMVATRTGLGKHLLTLTPAEASGYLTCFYVMNASYTTSTACIKISLLLQYTRVFDRDSRLWKVSACLVVFILLWGFTYSFLAWVPCLPVRDVWAIPRPETAHCYAFGSNDATPFAGTFESHAAVNMILDLLVLAIPIPLYFSKGISTRMRWSLVALFLMGLVANFFSVWRLVTVIEHKAATYPEVDPTWYAPVSLVLAALELDVASICASVPVFWPVIERHFGKIFITQEVEVTREARWTAHELDDRSELTGQGGQYRSDASDGELTKGDNLQPGEMNHYVEEYVMGRWDPITGAGNAKATVRSGGNGERRKWWRL